MAYYVDEGLGLAQVDDLDEAKTILRNAMENAKAFKDRMGFWPYWARECEVRKGREVSYDWAVGGGDLWAVEVIQSTKPMRTWTNERDTFMYLN